MLSVAYSAAAYGPDGYEITVECSVQIGIAEFTVIGLPDAAIRESEQRIVTGSESSGYPIPPSKIIINLAPADKKKEGTGTELAVLVGIYRALRYYDRDISECTFIGEISFSGEIRPVRGVLGMTIAAIQAGKTEIFVPYENIKEASVACRDGVCIYGVKDIRELVDHLTGSALISPAEANPYELLEKHVSAEDFSQVKGQYRAKKAMITAAVGGHNILLIGPPGSGKSMLSRRLPTILPKMTYEEALEATKIWSCTGMLNEDIPFVLERPFRAPHHSLSTAALVGGGKVPSPGEISLAHNGVLFLDEFPEFKKDSLEALRQPLEDRVVTITRAAGRMTYPASFMMVCAMNPCPCGYYGSRTGKCTCKPADVKAYMAKISGPMLDRIDIQVEMPELDFRELSDDVPAESSETIRQKVQAARELSTARFKAEGREDWALRSNSMLDTDELRTFCELDDECSRVMEALYTRVKLSARGYDRVLRVARSLADLDAAEKGIYEENGIIGGRIKKNNLTEAAQMRALDRKYF